MSRFSLGLRPSSQALRAWTTKVFTPGLGAQVDQAEQGLLRLLVVDADAGT